LKIELKAVSTDSLRLEHTDPKVFIQRRGGTTHTYFFVSLRTRGAEDNFTIFYQELDKMNHGRGVAKAQLEVALFHLS